MVTTKISDKTGHSTSAEGSSRLSPSVYLQRKETQRLKVARRQAECPRRRIWNSEIYGHSHVFKQKNEADLFRSFFVVRILEHILQLDLFRHGAISGRHCPEIAPPKSRPKGKILEKMAKSTMAHGREGEPCFKVSVCIYATEHRNRSTHLERGQRVRRRQ